MKKIYILAGIIIIAVGLQSGIKFSSVPPTGRTGATGVYCTGCHNSYALNSGGGSVTVNGLPTANYAAGQSFPFSLTINHSAADRKIWGFSIRAQNSAGATVGTFTTTNANAAQNTAELSHNDAVSTAAQASYTYTNLVWTAPTTPVAADNTITFYYVGNAANADGTNKLDYIYSGSSSSALPIDLQDFKASVQNKTTKLEWQTATETNSDHFDIEKSDDNQLYYSIGKVAAAGSSSVIKTYNFTDNIISYYDKPINYRLKLVDKDGAFKYSKIVSVQHKSNKSFVQNVYPTIVKSHSPVTAIITSDKTQPLLIELVDISGQVLQRYTETLVGGRNEVDFIITTTLLNNWVFARFTAGKLQQTIPLVVHP